MTNSIYKYLNYIQEKHQFPLPSVQILARLMILPDQLSQISNLIATSDLLFNHLIILNILASFGICINSFCLQRIPAFCSFAFSYH